MAAGLHYAETAGVYLWYRRGGAAAALVYAAACIGGSRGAAATGLARLRDLTPVRGPMIRLSGAGAVWPVTGAAALELAPGPVQDVGPAQLDEILRAAVQDARADAPPIFVFFSARWSPKCAALLPLFSAAALQ